MLDLGGVEVKVVGGWLAGLAWGRHGGGMAKKHGAGRGSEERASKGAGNAKGASAKGASASGVKAKDTSPDMKAKSAKGTSASDAKAKSSPTQGVSTTSSGKKPAKGSPFAALADVVKQRKLEATRALVASKVRASAKVAEAAKSKAASTLATTASTQTKAATMESAADPRAKGTPVKGPSTNAGERAMDARAAARTEGSRGSAPTADARNQTTSEKRGASGSSEGPLASYPYDDRVAFHDAFGDVRPLGAPAEGGRAKKPKASGVRGPRAVAERAHRDAAEEAARARLERLVVGGVSFEIRRDEHGVEAKRKGAAERTLLLLLRGELTPEARVDLHGLGREEAGRVVGRFIKDAHAKSRLTVLIIHGKGAHSEGGIGVLEETCVEALTKGGSAPYVEAFATAPTRFGGRGAIVARLRKR